MGKVIEEALKLPREEKLKLFQALQEDLGEDQVFREDELTPEQWFEINSRVAEMRTDKATLISRNELSSYLHARRNSL